MMRRLYQGVPGVADLSESLGVQSTVHGSRFTAREADTLHEECGVVAIYGHPHAAREAYLSLYALQHRGQESAGIATADGHHLANIKGMGLVSEIFTDDVLAKLPGRMAIGHTRYSTTGDSALLNAQPIRVDSTKGLIAIAHNGNLVNLGNVRARSGRCSAAATGRSAGRRCRATRPTSPAPRPRGAGDLPRQRDGGCAGCAWPPRRFTSRACPAVSAGSSTASAPRWATVFNDLVASGEVKAPIVIGRDHLDSGSVASPYRETEGMRDGSDAIADWPILNALLNTAAGASWVSFHHGGGVGIGKSLHAGQQVADFGQPILGHVRYINAVEHNAPARRHSRPPIRPSKVVLPLPLGPTMATTSPQAMAMLTPRSACTRPWPSGISLVTSAHQLLEESS